MTRWLALVVFVVAVTGLTAGATQYAITVDDGIDTPNKEVSLEGNTFTVRGIAAVAPGETVTASVTVPENTAYRVYVYGTFDGSREIVDSNYVDGKSTVTFDTSGYPPGSYMLALHVDGDYRALYPFIVSGATTQVTTPDTVTAGDPLHVTATTSPTSDAVAITGVEFVLYNSDLNRSITATKTADGYAATIDTSTLPPGDYTLYAVILNDSSTTRGEHEPIALSTRHTITVHATDDTATTPTTTTTTSQNTTTTTTTTMTTTTTPTTSRTTTSTTPASPTAPSTTRTSTATSSTGTSSNVITPNDSPTTTPAPTPGFTILTTLLALTLLSARARRR